MDNDIKKQLKLMDVKMDFLSYVTYIAMMFAVFVASIGFLKETNDNIFFCFMIATGIMAIVSFIGVIYKGVQYYRLKKH